MTFRDFVSVMADVLFVGVIVALVVGAAIAVLPVADDVPIEVWLLIGIPIGVVVSSLSMARGGRR